MIAIVAAVVFALTADGWPSAFAWLGAAGFLVTLVASVVVLVPLQRRIIAAAPARDAAVEAMRSQWFRGHLGRSVLSTASFVSLVLAVIA